MVEPPYKLSLKHIKINVLNLVRHHSNIVQIEFQVVTKSLDHHRTSHVLVAVEFDHFSTTRRRDSRIQMDFAIEPIGLHGSPKMAGIWPRAEWSTCCVTSTRSNSHVICVERRRFRTTPQTDHCYVRKSALS